ncbi:transglutaminase domain-containing protein [Bacillus sp. FJAT-27445]|uniref:transglutaminase domain-containing protein n=1 Tax=Bacillus sp. FJAT-27445 TaxID=1679166 RepID=UPI0007439C9B|nr:transglutaminase domain-containing protein [Bacillus sp. FJAT-27445]
MLEKLARIVVVFTVLVAASMSFSGGRVKAALKPVDYMGVRVVTHTSLEQKIALNLLAGNTKFSLTEFKEIKDMAYLGDRVNKVIAQNPLILGVINFGYQYSSKSKVMTVQYTENAARMKKKQQAIVNQSKRILDTLIKPKMTDRQKFKAIYDYLDVNAKYDFEAFNEGSVMLRDTDPKYWTAYNPYGVLVEKNGVCQSYAGSFQLLSTMLGLNSVVVTGTMDGGGHSWNKVKLNGQWVHIDPTSNRTNNSIPYMLYEANDAFAKSIGYEEDKLYWTDNEIAMFASKGKLNDYYIQNKLVAGNLKELKDKIAEAKNRNSDFAYIRSEQKFSSNQVFAVLREVTLLSKVSMTTSGNGKYMALSLK